LKDNIKYRLFSAAHQYLVFLREMATAEHYLQNIYQQNPRYIDSFPMGNPFFEKVELELSSIFDNIVFQIASLFDYLSHIICYISFKNKSNTLYGSKRYYEDLKFSFCWIFEHLGLTKVLFIYYIRRYS